MGKMSYDEAADLYDDMLQASFALRDEAIANGDTVGVGVVWGIVSTPERDYHGRRDALVAAWEAATGWTETEFEDVLSERVGAQAAARAQG